MSSVLCALVVSNFHNDLDKMVNLKVNKQKKKITNVDAYSNYQSKSENKAEAADFEKLKYDERKLKCMQNIFKRVTYNSSC